MLSDLSIGLIGAGNMGFGIASGLIDSGRIDAARIVAVDVRPEALTPLDQLGVRTSTDIEAALAGTDLVCIGVKPQVAPQVLAQIGPHVATDQVLVSIMAGVKTAAIEAHLPPSVAVVRAMPQSLVRLGAAATGLCPGRHAADRHLALATALFDALGTTVTVDETQMDAVTGLSGSGPAYVYTAIEALADGGVRAGLPRDTALKLAAQTVLGAARLVLESGQHPAVLRDQVTSPGGTTIAGLHMLEEKGLRDALISAVQAATQRSAELGRDPA